jgi:hypothetical protein
VGNSSEPSKSNVSARDAKKYSTRSGSSVTLAKLELPQYSAASAVDSSLAFALKVSYILIIVNSLESAGCDVLYRPEKRKRHSAEAYSEQR